MLWIGAGANQDLREAGPRSTPSATGLGCRGRESRGHHANVPVTGRCFTTEFHRLSVGEATTHGTTSKVSNTENKHSYPYMHIYVSFFFI